MHCHTNKKGGKENVEIIYLLSLGTDKPQHVAIRHYTATAYCITNE